MGILLGSSCHHMACRFCPSWDAEGIQADQLDELDDVAHRHEITITGNEPLNSPRFFATVAQIRERAPHVGVLVETTGLPLLEPSLRAKAAALENVTFVVPLYGKDRATNEAVTQNPTFFDSVQALLSTELHDRVRLQTMALRANIDSFPEFLDWAETQGLTFQKYRAQLLRESDPERNLYRSTVASFTLVAENYLSLVRSEPRSKFDGSLAALPRCVLAAGGVEQALEPWSTMSRKVHADTSRSTCPYTECRQYNDCAKVSDVYQEQYGLAGIAPIL